MIPNGPKGLRDSAERERRLARLREPHIAPLTAYVTRLRALRGGGESVPWFDPAGGGVHARVLLLLESPGPMATSQALENKKRRGSGFISPDNDDESAKNAYEARDAGGLRPDELVCWNVVPWYLGDGNVKAPRTAEIEEALPFLSELLELLPRLEVVVTMGRKAQRGWSLYVKRWETR